MPLTVGIKSLTDWALRYPHWFRYWAPRAVNVILRSDCRWKLRIVMMPTLLSLVASAGVITTIAGATSDDTVCIVTTLCFFVGRLVDHPGVYLPVVELFYLRMIKPGSAFIKPDQLDPWIKDQIKITLLSTIAPLQLPNFVSCGRDKPSHMTQNLVTVGATLWTAEYFLVDPWSMDQADLVW